MNHYAVLGLLPHASPDDVKKAYYRMAKKYHPDHNSSDDAATKFREINDAYEAIVKNHEKIHPKTKVYENYKWKMDFDLNDIHKREQREWDDILRKAKSRPINMVHSIPLSECYNENTILINCYGQDICVPIPKGVFHGQVLYYPANEQHGSINLKIHVTPDNGFTVRGKDVFCLRTINVFDAMIGCDIIVNTPTNKKLKVSIPSGSGHNDMVRLKNQGIPATIPGDFYVIIELEIPKMVSEKHKRKLQSIRNEIYPPSE